MILKALAVFGLSNNQIFFNEWMNNTNIGSTSFFLSSFLTFLQDQRIVYLTYTVINVYNITSGKVDISITSRDQVYEQLSSGRLVSSGSSNGIKIWNESNGTSLGSMATSTAQTYLKQLRAENYLASADDGGYIYLWNLTNNSIAMTLRKHQYRITEIDEFDNGYLVSVSHDYNVKIWNFSTAACVSSLNPFYNQIFGVRIISNSTFVISGFIDKVYIIQVNNDFNMSIAQIITIPDGAFYVTDFEVSNSSILIMSYYDARVGYYDLNTRQYLQTFTMKAYVSRFILLGINKF